MPLPGMLHDLIVQLRHQISVTPAYHWRWKLARGRNVQEHLAAGPLMGLQAAVPAIDSKYPLLEAHSWQMLQI